MATVLNAFDPEDEKNKTQGQTPTFEAPTIGGPQGGSVATPGASSNPSNPTGTNSGSFTNIQKYINANKNFNADKGGLAGQIVGGISQQAQNAKQNVQGAQNAFNTQVQGQVSAFSNPELVTKAFDNPTDFAGNQADVDKFAQIRDAAYKGPQGLQDLKGDQNLANLQIQTAGVNDAVKQGQTEAGRYNLLKTMFGKQGYSKGQQNLDNLLIQGNQGQLKQIQGSRQIADDTNRSLTSGAQQATEQATAATKQAEGVRADTRGKLNEAITKQDTEIQNRLGGAQQQQQQAMVNAVDQLNKGYISQNDMARFAPSTPGLSSGMDLYNFSDYLNPRDLVTAGAAPTAQTLATKADYDKFKALSTLMGGPSSTLANEDASRVLDSYANSDQADQFLNNPLYNLDTNRLLGAINSAKADYESQSRSPQDRMSEATNEITNLNAALQDPNLGLGYNVNTVPDRDRASFIQRRKTELAGKLAAEQQKLADNTSAFEQLKKLFKVGNKLNVAGTTDSTGNQVATIENPLDRAIGDIKFDRNGGTLGGGFR